LLKHFYFFIILFMQQYQWQSLLLEDELFLPQIFSAYR